MKTRTLLTWLMACGLMTAIVATASAENAKVRTAKVVRIKGSARYSTGDNNYQTLTVGTVLSSGAVVQTAADSLVDLVLTESAGTVRRTSIGEYVSYQPTVQQDVVRIDSDSVLAIDRLSATDTGAETVTDTELDLRSGRIFGAVKKTSAASTFEIKIPNGIAGIRGTIFAISAFGVVSVLQGAVSLAYHTGQGNLAETIQQGFEFDARTGQLYQLPAEIERLLGGLPRRQFTQGPPQLNPRDVTNDNPSRTTGLSEGDGDDVDD